MSNKKKLSTPQLRKSLESELGDLDEQLEKINALLGEKGSDTSLAKSSDKRRKGDGAAHLKTPVSKTSILSNYKTPISSSKQSLTPSTPSLRPSARKERESAEYELEGLGLSHSGSGQKKKKKLSASKKRDTDFVMDDEPAAHTPQPSSAGTAVSRLLFDKRPRMKTFPSLGLQCCAKILDTIIHHASGWPFLSAVDPAALNVPDYFIVIQCPMDLGKIYDRLHCGYYTTVLEFGFDVRLVWSNALKYNQPNNIVYVLAKELSELFEKAFVEALEIDILKSIPKKQILEISEELKGTMEIIESQLVELRRGGIASEADADLFQSDLMPHIVARSEVDVSEFTDEEKIQLHNLIFTLPEEYMLGIVQIVEDEMPHFLHADAAKIQLDLAQLDNRTLSRISHYTNWCLKDSRTLPELRTPVTSNKRPRTRVYDSGSSYEESQQAIVPLSTPLFSTPTKISNSLETKSSNNSNSTNSMSHNNNSKPITKSLIESKLTKLPPKTKQSSNNSNGASDAKSLSAKTFQQLKHTKSDAAGQSASRPSSSKKEKSTMSLYKQQQQEEKLQLQQLQLQQQQIPITDLNNREAYINVPVTRRQTQTLRVSSKEQLSSSKSSSKKKSKSNKKISNFGDGEKKSSGTKSSLTGSKRKKHTEEEDDYLDYDENEEWS